MPYAFSRQVYENDVNKIDVMVGLLSETPLPGFIFGEAIYTIFVLQVKQQGWAIQPSPQGIGRGIEFVCNADRKML